MLALFLLLIFGLGMSYFATQNTEGVHILIGNYFFQGVPLYILVIGSLLLGVFISWLISLVNTFSSSLTIHGKVTEINEAQKTIKKLLEENHSLELQVTRLKMENTRKNVNLEDKPEKQQTNEKPSFMNRLSHLSV